MLGGTQGFLEETLQLKTPNVSDIPTTAVAAADVALVANITGGVSPVPISTAEKKWLRFVVTLPKYTVAPVTVSLNHGYASLAASCFVRKTP